MKEISEEVFYAEGEIGTFGPQTIDLLKERAGRNRRKRARLCMHKDANDSVHEMIIVHSKGNYVQPHKHMNKPESFHVVEGLADVFFFDENGKVTNRISMGDQASGRPSYYRISGPVYHTLIIRSDLLVFHETTKGPFDRTDTIFPAWAPGEDADKETIRKYMDQIMGLSVEAK